MVFGITDSMAFAFKSYVLVIFSLTIGIFVMYNMRINVQDKITSAPVLDSFIYGYTPEIAMKTLTKMSNYELAIYQSLYTNGYDIVLPFAIAGVQLGLLAFNYPILNTKLFKIVMFIPFIYLLFDLSENYIHYTVLVLFPMRSKIQTHIDKLLFFGGWFDLLKYIFFFSGLFFIALGFITNFISLIIRFTKGSNKIQKTTKKVKSN